MGVSFGQLAAFEGTLQRERAAEHDRGGLGQPGSQLVEGTAPAAELHRHRPKRVRFVRRNEDHLLAIDDGHRLDGHDQRSHVGLASDELDAPEQAAAQASVGNLEGHAHRQ